MKLIFLHGLGQHSRAWDQVQAELQDLDSVSLDLFEAGRLPDHFEELTGLVEQELAKSKEPVVLVGLSLGAMLALSLLGHPRVSGAVVVACQYRLKNNRAYQLQSFLFKLLPNWFFKKQGMDKANLMRFYGSLAGFDLTDQLATCDKPVLLLCGDQDKINHKASRELASLLKHSRFDIIPDSGHEMTKDQPGRLAMAIRPFLAGVDVLADA